MADEDKAKRRRAKRLHERIAEITEPQKSETKKEKRRSPPRVPTPREFIHEKMRELKERSKQHDESDDSNDKTSQSSSC